MPATRRLTALALTCVCVLAALGAATAAAAGRATCSAAGLRARVLEENGAVGTIVVSITLTNTGRACTLRGYAGLRLQSATGPLPTTVVHGGHPAVEAAPKLVRLAKGARATILIAYNHVPSGDTPCPTATKLLIAPPAASGSLTLALQLNPCRRGTIWESPVLSGVRHAP